jgi:predicted HicB family RNase H-like nuclease
MRTVIALCFLALFAGALAHKSKGPVEESKLVASLKGLFQLASADEYDEVAEVLAQVREEVEGILSRVRGDYGDQKADHENIVSHFEADIASITEAHDNTNTQLEHDRDHADQLQKDIQSSLDSINAAQADQDNENSRRVEVHNAFRVKVDQLNAAIEAAEDALKLLKEIDNEDLEGSFLEISNKKIKKHFEAIHKSLSNLKLTGTIGPICDMLVEIASAGINHELIAQIEDLINQLLESLSQEVDSAVEADNADEVYSRNAIKTSQDTIDSQTDAATGNQSQLSVVESNI